MYYRFSFEKHQDLFNVSLKFDIQFDEIYNNVLDSIKWQKVEDFFHVANFWELCGYEEYHSKAVVYDYVDYINGHSTCFIPNDELLYPTNSPVWFYKNETFVRSNYEEKRTHALALSHQIMDKEIYQNPNTDVKFVSLSPIDLAQLKKSHPNNQDFESLICVSGFLSQRDNLKESWHSILDKSDENKPVFGFKWPAEDVASIFSRILLELTNIRFDNLGDVTFGDIMALNAVRTIAIESGKLLAHSLILEYPAYLPKVSFVSFSMGTEVVKSCLEELHRLGAKNIVNNVYLMGGAATLTAADSEIFEVMSGDLVQVYTPSDRVLDLYQLTTGFIPIGKDKLGE